MGSGRSRSKEYIGNSSSFANNMGESNAEIWRTDAKDTLPLSLDEKRNLIYDFVDRTGINVNAMGLNDIPGDTLNLVLSTVEEQLNKHGKDTFALKEIQIKPANGDEDKEGSLATMDTSGNLWLDPGYFSLVKEDLERMTKAGSDSHLHPKGSAKSHIIHELGHARFNANFNKMFESYDYDFGLHDDWYAVYHAGKEIDGKIKYDGWFKTVDKSLYQKKSLYYDFVQKVTKFENKVRQDPYLRKMWGGNINLSLKGLVSYQHGRSDGISDYAMVSFHEMCAEAYADVELNGKNASYLSKLVYDEFLR